MTFRRFFPFLFLIVLSLSFSVSCDRNKMNRLFNKDAAGSQSAGGVKEMLTPEQKKISDMLNNTDVFQPGPDGPAAPVVPEPPPKPEINTLSVVSILCYHNFSDRESRNEMMLNKDHFRKQMQAIKDASLPVISMADFLAWKRSEKNIPDFCLLITMDDGWLGVHQHAMPILKEFGFPFTAFLYTKYIGVGGQSMSPAEIAELQANGGEIGSHSVSHQNLNAKNGKTDEAYLQWLVTETKGARDGIKQKINVDAVTYAYPFGNYNDIVAKVTAQAGYTAAFTVAGKKVTWETPMMELGRFVVNGKDPEDKVFALATSFRGHGATIQSHRLAVSGSEASKTAEVVVPVSPSDQEKIPERMPKISVDLSQFDGIDPASLKMKVSGFNTVAGTYDADSGVYSYQIPRKLRGGAVAVNLQFKRGTEKKEEVISWSFKIDPLPLYLNAQKSVKN